MITSQEVPLNDPARLQLGDFTVLGRTFPEDSKKYGKRICMAGFSPSLNSFVRVYPLLVPTGENHGKNEFKARHRYAMKLRRNPNDSRMESWRVEDVDHPTSTPWDKSPEVKKSEIIKWLETKCVSSTHDLDPCRLSLGVIRLEAGEWEGHLQPRDEYGRDVKQTPGLFSDDVDAPGLFDDLQEEMGEDHVRVHHVPYLKFRDGRNGKPRKLQIREWGAYLGLAFAFNDAPEKLWTAPGYHRDHSLLVVVGNMCHHRNVWLAIKTFQLDKPKERGPSLLDGFGSGSDDMDEANLATATT